MAIVKTNAQHYSDIAAAIRSKNGSVVQYKPGEMGRAILDLESGSLMSSIIVYAPTGSEVTLTCGDVVRTVPENAGVWRFENCDLGTWTVSASKDGMSREETVEISENGQLMRYEVQIVYLQIYGVCRDITSSSPEWSRTDSGLGMTATASVGSVVGSSDFDRCYPWSEIHRETLSTGDVMVKIPKFWYRRYRVGNMDYLQIADSACNGFKLHPAFCHGGVERDAIYVGAYETGTDNCSKSGVSPQISVTRGAARTAAKSKGSGWGILDVSTVSALQMLFLVEYATYDSQTAIGKGYTSVTASHGRFNTGSADAVPNLTGCPAESTGAEEVVWRGVEALWGNIFEFLDGVNVDCTNKKYYICNDPDKYADDTFNYYTPLSFPMVAAGTSGLYVTKLGIDTGNNDHVMFPSEAADGSSSTYICDATANAASGTTIIKYGGRWYSKDQSGIFMIDASNISTQAWSHGGFRLIYIPQEVSA